MSDQMYSVPLQYVAKQKTVEEGVQDMWEVRLTTRSNSLIIVSHISLRLHHKLHILLQSLDDTKLKICDMVEADNDGYVSYQRASWKEQNQTHDTSVFPAW